MGLNPPERFENNERAGAQSGSARAALSLRSMSTLDMAAVPGILIRQWRLIAIVVSLVLLLVGGGLSQIKNRYTAETLLSIDERGSQLLGQENAMAMGVTLNNQVDTEVEIIASTAVFLSVIDRLALWRDSELGFTGSSSLDKFAGFLGISIQKPSLPAASRLVDLDGDLQAQLVKKLQDAIKVTRRGLTSIISIKATSKDAEKSALLANAVAESYLDLQIEAKANTAKRAASFLSARLDQIASDIQDVDAKIERFILAQSQTLGTLPERTELSNIRAELDSLAVRRSQFQDELARLQDIKRNPNNVDPDHISAEMRSLAEKRVELSHQISSAVTSKDIQSQLDAIDKQLTDAALVRIQSVQEEISKSDTQKIDLSKQLQDLFGRQKIPSEIAVKLYRLQRESENDRKLYDNYSTRLGEVQQQVSLVLPNTRIVAAAIIPHEASYPKTVLFLSLSAVLGLLLGIAVAVIREYLVGGFASAAQVEAVTGIPILATIPNYEGIHPHDAILTSPFSIYAESVRRLRIGVENKLEHLSTKTILVTSTEPGEGKSTLAVTLARALSTAGHKTVLIDGDLRHPSVKKMVGKKSPRELIELLPLVTDRLNLLSCLGKEEHSGLSVLTTEVTLNQVSDTLIGSANFVQLLVMACAKFEYVVIDCPPIGYVVDAQVMSRFSDLVLYIVKQNSTSQTDVVFGLTQIASPAGHPMVSAVLNNTRNLLGGYYARNSRYNKYYKRAS